MPVQKELHTIIFSKDRALQLDSLLRSIRDKYSELPARITILYAAKGKFAEAYDCTSVPLP